MVSYMWLHNLDSCVFLNVASYSLDSRGFLYVASLEFGLSHGT